MPLFLSFTSLFNHFFVDCLSPGFNQYRVFSQLVEKQIAQSCSRKRTDEIHVVEYIFVSLKSALIHETNLIQPNFTFNTTLLLPSSEVINFSPSR